MSRPLSRPLSRPPSRPLRLALAALLAALALLSVPIALGGTTIGYLLPAPDGQATSHRAVFGPGVAAAALAVLIALATLAWVVLNLVGRPARWAWLLVGSLVLIDLVVVTVVTGLPRPTF